MENIIELSTYNKVDKNLDLDSKIDLDLVKNRNEFANIVENVIDKGANYVIRGMPINNHIKDILIDVKDSLKTKDVKEILKTAVNSSIREGLEVLSLPKEILKDISKIKDIAVSGGLREGINASIEIISKKYLGENVYSVYIKDFFDKVKDFIMSNEFLNKINAGLTKCVKKIDDFKNACNEWYQAYDKFDLESINHIANVLNKKKSNINFDSECMNQNNVIQNMTQLINNKKDKLSELQMQICSSI
ncbi:MAG: hypothetical protein Q4D02_00845 [Clostridia bacterium]|nr:hypothetical protein [Clostridia bacterium]